MKSPLTQKKMPVDLKELVGGGVSETNKGQALKSQQANCCLSPQNSFWFLDLMFKKVSSKFM